MRLIYSCGGWIRKQGLKLARLRAVSIAAGSCFMLASPESAGQIRLLVTIKLFNA